MDKTEQRQKQNTVSIDRISDLPDSIICHILSFLSTKESVATSILGQRWRYLWSYVPNLDFESEEENIISRVMLLRKVQTVNTFRLYHHNDCDAYQFETWVTFAITRGVQKLDLTLEGEDVLPGLPRCLFTCETLVDLRLYTCSPIPISGAVSLPRLKILHLIYVQFEADESLPHLLSGCSVLEELEIRLDKDMDCCNVSSPPLKRLVLDFLYEGCGGISDRLEINTPALEYLEIDNFSCEHIKCGVLTSLITAGIKFYEGKNKEDYYLYCRSLLEFFDRLCNVKFLKLDFSLCRKIVDSVLSAWTTSFRNLTQLKLTSHCLLLSKMLENADNLEILTFKELFEDKGRWTKPTQQVPTCLLSNLRIIKLVHIQGKKHEFEMIRYLLRNAKVLKRMKISYSFGSIGEIIMLKKISLFERGSATCQVAFVRIR